MLDKMRDNITKIYIKTFRRSC